MTEQNWPIAIDPPGCGCTECIVGEYVPLERATAQQVGDMLAGRIANNLDSDAQITTTTRGPIGYTTTTVEMSGMTWEIKLDVPRKPDPEKYPIIPTTLAGMTEVFADKDRLAKFFTPEAVEDGTSRQFLDTYARVYGGRR